MPAEDVSDLKEVLDAINRLCETMKNSTCREPEPVCDEPELIFKKVKIFSSQMWDRVNSVEENDSQCNESGNIPDTDTNQIAPVESCLVGNLDWKNSQASLASSDVSAHREHEERWREGGASPSVEPPKPEQWKDSQVSLASSEVSVQRDVHEERWSDTLTSPPSSDISATRESRERWSDCRSPPDIATSDTEPAAQCEPASEYFTASSEVSLSDTEQKEVVIAGHVAAMRERFESMTRANTPCPELVRSLSPSLDLFRNVTPSPDRLG